MDFDRINELGFEKNPKWHSVVLVVAFNRWWNIFIGIQCFVTFLMCTYILAYRILKFEMMIIRYLTDLCYLFELICNIVYRMCPSIRKLKYAKTREWYFIFIDILSVIPFDLFYVVHGSIDGPDKLIETLLIQNRILRIYRIFLLEYFYETISRKAHQYVLIFIFQYTSRVLIVGNVLHCVWVLVEKSVPCDPDVSNCFIWYQMNILNVIGLNWSGSKESFQKSWERVIVSIAMLCGYCIIYLLSYPKLFYYSMLLYNKRALFYERFGKLQVFIRNMVFDAKLEAQILQRFNDVWSKGRVDSNLGPLLKNIPLALRKEISTDIYWESLRHSELFREVSRSCKRSLTLLMTTEYYHPEEVIYFKGQEKLKMMFLVQGILQIMAEENEEFPVLSFSSGTVFGEISLFFYVKSHVILKCKDYSELQILTIANVTSVLKDYPKDKKLVFHNLHERLTMAKHAQWRKDKFVLQQKSGLLSVEKPALEESVKWLKRQWRAIWETHKRHLEVIKAKEEGLGLHSWQSRLKTQIRIEFVSNYLDLIVLSDLIEEKKDIVCFRTSFPWSINPSTQFLRIWYHIVFITSLIPALLYPASTAWAEHFPQAVFNVSFVVTLVFITDVLLKLFTAVQTKHKIITEFSSVLRYLFRKPTFYFDVIAAFPYQIIVFYTLDITSQESYKVGLLLHPALLKSYLLLMVKVPLGDYMDKITIFKNCLLYFLLIYWVAEVIQLLGIRNLINVSDSWIKRFIENKTDVENLEKYYLSLIKAVVMAMSIPDYLMYSSDTVVILCSSAVKYFFFLFLCFFLSQLYGTFIVKIYGIETFQVLIKRITKFLENMYVSEEMTSRFLRSLRFQWDYDKADYFSSKISIIKTIPFNFRTQLYLETTYKTLRLCSIFQDEPHDFLIDVLEASYVVAVPRGSVLVTYGHTSHMINILHQGYCQLNSYLSKDVYAEMGRAIKIGPGYIFPFLSSICSVPSPVSVVTTTDCEVIMIRLNDLLCAMFKHDMFKDLMESVREVNLEKTLVDVEPGLLTVNLNNPPGKVEEGILKKAFEHLGFFWKLLYYCCPKKSVLNRKFFWYWDSFYVVCLILLCWLWPSCFGLLLTSSYIIIPILTAGKAVTILHLFFRFYLSYFNRKGLLVTHPVYTCLNYVTSSFFLDFIRAIPFFQIYLYGFSDAQAKPHLAPVILLFIQLFFKMYYVMVFLNDLGNILKKDYFIRMLKVTLGLFLTFNMFINMMMFVYLNWTYSGPYRVVAFKPMPNRFPEKPHLLKNDSLWDYYIFTSHWALCCLTTNNFLLHESSGSQLYLEYIQGFIGTIGILFMCVWVASNSIFANIRGNIYQEQVFSFMSFLKYEKADDGLMRYVSAYYKYEWSQTHGETLKSFGEHLPTHLHEELMYPIYRPTFSRNRVFDGSDEGFFKILATRVNSVFFNRGSVIMFQNEVQSDIFFVHKGKCFVYDWFVVLNKGSIMGDIQRKGLIQNKVYALTHVELLKISSDEFFNILNNFYDLEANFLYRVKTSQNFVKAEVSKTKHQMRIVDSTDILKAFCLKKKEVAFEDESIFEDPGNSSIYVLKKLKFSPRKKRRVCLIYPGTWKMNVYTVLQVSVTFATIISIPFFSSFGGLTLAAFIFIGATDFFWLVVIILTFRVGIIDHQKGNVITDFKSIAKNYAKRANGLVLDVISLIPFEMIPVSIAGGIKSANGKYVSLGRVFRLCRVHCFSQFVGHIEEDSLDSSIYLKYFFVVMTFVSLLFQSVSFYVMIATEPSIVAARDDHKLTSDQFFAFVMAFQYVINFVSSANLCVIIPDTRSQLHFFNLLVVSYLCLKSYMISVILSLLYVNGVATAYYKSQVLELESYLTGKDTSPSIIQEVLTYRTNLLRLSRSENMPSLLRKSPSIIRVMVMKDIYLENLLSCPLFKDIERIFLEQLVARAEREFYFPGQKIVEQGDVDHRMYFIHSGEVYIIDQTKEAAYVEYLVSIIKEGESFGEAQGLWLSIPHSFTYRARTLVDMLAIHSRDWIDLRRSFPDIVKKIFDKAKKLKYI